MTAKFFIDNPNDVNCTLTLTFALSEWKRLRDEINKQGVAAWSLHRTIDDLVRQAEQKLFCNSDKETQP